jgi:Rab3 GTPase-activating protein catalytic subunit
MLIPGNTWQTVWKSAKAVPARRQKRLFDDTKEAEKVLHFFESLTLGQICQMTVAPLFHSSLIRLQEELADVRDIVPNCQEIEDKLKQNCCLLSRERWNSQKNISKKKWEILANDIGGMELTVNQVKSLKKKLFPERSDLSGDVSFLTWFL